MRIAFGLSSVAFRRHESHADLSTFLSDVGHSLWIGKAAEVYASFWSAELRHEYGSSVTRIGIILEHENAVPQCAVAPDGSLFAIGFNRCVAFVHDSPPAARENMLRAPFFNFVTKDKVLVAVHELGCTAFCVSSLNRKWEVNTDVVETASLDGNTLVLNCSDGAVCRIDLRTGEQENAGRV